MARRSTRRRSVGGVQLPLWETESAWTPPSLSDLPDWSRFSRVGVDVETKDPKLKDLGIGVRRDGRLVGVSFSFEDAGDYYLPFGHEGGDNLPEENVLAYLRDNARRFPGVVVGNNLSYDLDYLFENDVTFDDPSVVFADVQVADPLIYELHDRYGLDHLCARHGLPGKDETALRLAASDYGIDPKSELWRLPARHVGAYAEADSRRPLQVLRRQERLLDENDLMEVWRLECAVLPVLVRMRRRGVPINFDRLDEIERWSLREETEALGKVERLTGVRVPVGGVWKPDLLAPVLEALGIDYDLTTTNKPNIDKFALARAGHPATYALLWARKVNKLRTTFAASVRRYETNGRIHCTFNQIARETEKGEMRGARFGRLSAVDPNLQQQPSPDKDPELAGEWRKVYEAEEGGRWSCNDYKQQEPKWATHYAAVMNLTGARAAAKAYREDPNLDNHNFMAELTGLPRSHAKITYLGILYGEGGAKLCDDLGLPTRWAHAHGRGRDRRVEYFEEHIEALDNRAAVGEGYVWRAAGEEGQTVLDQFDERAPFIKELSKAGRRQVERNGFVKTISGRKLHFPRRDDGSYDWAHKSLNRVIQGTSADQMKRALVALDAAGHHLMLQVHDETDSTVADDAESVRIGECMRDVVTGEVPFTVDNEVGPSWGDIEKLP